MHANEDFEVKKTIKINNDFLKNKIGTGQASLFILKVLQKTNKKYIFIDEPEKFCNPSLINYIVHEINSLLANNKDVYISTHSPYLLNLLDWNIENLSIFNELEFDKDNNITNSFGKKIDLEKIFSDEESRNFIKLLKNSSSPDLNIIAKYLECSNKVTELIKLKIKDAISLFFSNIVCLLEGQNDAIYYNHFFKDDIGVVPIITNGKFIMFVYMKIFNEIRNKKKSELNVIFDTDKFSKKWAGIHTFINDYIVKNCNKYIEFTDNIEEEIFKKNGIDINNKNDSILFFDKLKEFENPKIWTIVPHK